MASRTLPLRVYVNGRFLTQAATGVQRYALESLNAMDALLDNDCTARWTVLAPKGVDSQPRWRNIELCTVGNMSGHLWEQFELPRYASDGWLLTLSGAPSVLHSANLFAIHDMAIYDMPSGYSLLYRTYYRMLYRFCVNRAKAIFTVSEFSRDRLESLFPKASAQIIVTYNGVDHSRLAGTSQRGEAFDLKVLNPPYILAVSSLAPNKNFGAILKLSEMLGDTDLRIAVVGAMNPKVFGNAKLASSRICSLGYVSDDELERLYRHATCFVFPSFYEGFGLPPIEAMSLGCPVVASNTASIPEICGDAALYFNPLSIEDLQSQLRRVLFEPNVALELRSRGEQQARKYTWSKVAQIILSTTQALAQK